MASSWHAFLYGSFDAAGVMTVDKPPLALWVQALSVRVFGFHSLSMLVPQALMGVASRRARLRPRRAAASAAPPASSPGSCSRSTPITVAISRHNNPDALLVLCSRRRAVVRRPRARGRPHALAGAGRASRVGLGFETKMAAALLVVPGDRRARTCGSRRAAAGRASRQLLAGGAAMAVGRPGAGRCCCR